MRVRKEDVVRMGGRVHGWQHQVTVFSRVESLVCIKGQTAGTEDVVEERGCTKTQ